MDIDALKAFGQAVRSKFSLAGSISPEDQLKPTVSDLLKSVGELFGLSIETRTEAHLSEHKVRPDIAVYVNGLITGYVELKAPGLGADPTKLKGDHNKKQWEKLKALPNLIYTDGQEWALYRGGERPLGQPIVRFQDRPDEVGAKAISENDGLIFEKLFRDFLTWKPSIPQTPSALAKYLAPLSRFLRSEIEQAVQQKGSAVELLATEWRQFFFPDSDAAQFADAYAQTVTYAMLLARLSGAQNLATSNAAKTLDKNNGLLARTLELLGHPEARKELSVGFELLQRSLEALDPHDFLKSKPDLWLYFYEDFLAAYDPRLRKDYGVYYTPREVVELQVRLTSQLLEERFGKKLGFADDGVVFLDPAVGTGTYPVAAIKSGLEKVKTHSGSGAISARAKQMAENMYGFEKLVGPYAVAHLRLSQALEGAINSAKSEKAPEEKLQKRLKIFLADTLESPNGAPPGGLDLTHKALTEEHEAARRIKNEGEVLVCLGNPPYDRQRIDQDAEGSHRKGGWVRFGDQLKGGAPQEEQGQKPIFDDFLEPARKAGHGVYLQVMYNDYLYFWRWALWRMFEQQSSGGIVTFITASSFLAGPGFIGVRELMRRTFDEMWVIDLGGDNLGTRKTPNVFNIQTPVAITIGLRGNAKKPGTPAKVRYTKIDAPTREAKLAALDLIPQIEAINWRTCADAWHSPFLPVGQGDFFNWPKLEDLFPWRYNGTQWFRGWTVAPTKELLKERLARFVAAPKDEKKKLFKESANRKIDKSYKSELPGGGQKSASLLVEEDIANINITPFGWRSFDRAWAIVDARFGDRLRKPLWSTLSNHQIFFTSLMAVPLGAGPAMQCTVNLPDCHIVRGSYGGRDIFPLFRDADGKEPNITAGLLDVLQQSFGFTVSATDFAAYVYALLTTNSYSVRFWNELETPGPRVPITKDGQLFSDVVKLGTKLIWLHTFAHRYQISGQGKHLPKGAATTVKGISSEPHRYPADFEYNSETSELRVGDGLFGPISPEVWEFEVSGLKVLHSWLSYRMESRGGKKSSPLDDMRPHSWTARMSDELLELLWVLEETLSMETVLTKSLDAVVVSDCFLIEELPQPTPDQRKAPGTVDENGGLLGMMGVEAEEADEE